MPEGGSTTGAAADAVEDRSPTGDPRAASARPATPDPPPGRLPRRARACLSLEDFERAGARHLPRPVLGYVAGAAEENAARADNRAAFAEWAFLPRYMRDVSGRSQSVELFGRTWATPFGIPPMGMAALSAYRGDLVLAAAAARADVPFVMSGSSLIRLEDVVAANPEAWFQAYLPGEPSRILALVERVARAGYGTLVVTADVPVAGNRENNTRNRFSSPLRPSLRLALDGLARPRWLLGTAARTLLNHGMPHFENSYAERGAPILSRNLARDFSKREHLDWSHLALIRRHWRGRLVLKGVLHPDDARRARDEGADGVVVSNHGGRQLDHAAGGLRALPAVVEAVGRDLPVMLDGGVRRGTDVLKALALGARLVFVGRPMLHAAAVGGEAGVARAIAILSEEVDRDMALLGVNRPGEVGPEFLVRIPPRPGGRLGVPGPGER